MRVLILTHPRSGGFSLLKYIVNELKYSQFHEPFNNLTNVEINSKLLVMDDIVVKDFPHHIESKGYNLFDVISKFDKIIPLSKSVEIFLLNEFNFELNPKLQ